MRTGVEEREGRIIWQARFLSCDYLPERIIGRAGQKEKLLTCLSPMREGQRPLSAWLYGPAGTGKTTLARIVAREVCHGHAARFHFYVNCWERRSLYSVVQAIVESLKVLGAEAQDANVKLDRIRQVVKDCPVAIILDDVDRVAPSERERTIYTLLGLPRAGLICISNQKETLLALEERTRSRLSPVVVAFPRYEPTELEQVLFERAKDGLIPGSWSRGILAQLAERAGGDARAAIKGLLHVAVSAEEAGKEKLTAAAMPDRLSGSDHKRQEEVVSRLSFHERLIYELARQSQPVLSTALRDAYNQQCRARNVTPVARRTFSKYVKTMGDAGLISVDQRSIAGKGRLIQVRAT